MYDITPRAEAHLPGLRNGHCESNLSGLQPRFASTPLATSQAEALIRRLCPQIVDTYLKQSHEASSIPYLIPPNLEPSPAQYVSSHEKRMARGLHRPAPSATGIFCRGVGRDGFCSAQKSLAAEKSPFARNTGMMEAGNEYEAQIQPEIYSNKTRHTPPSDQAIVLEMVRWVIYAARPLYTEELLDAIRIQMMVEISESDIDRLCCGLLTKTEIGTTWAVESSARKFLESHDSDKATSSSRTISTLSHEIMAAICLKKLDHKKLRPRSNTSTEFNMSKIDMDVNHQDLVSYARHYWRFHYAQAESQSYFLSGMLHEKLRDDRKYDYGVFFSKIPPLRTEFETATQGSLSLGTTSFLNAALDEGVRSSMAKLVKLELEMGASPNAPDASGNTPLHFAAMVGNLNIVKLLVSYRGNPNIRSRLGETPLSLAIENGHIETFKLLLDSESTYGSAYPGTETGQMSSRCTYQKLSLLVSRTSCCCSCESRFVISKIFDIKEDEGPWPPITISNKSKSQQIRRHSMMNDERDCCDGTIISEQMAMLKWFSGIHMYKALGTVASRGIEDVLRLLILAGNNMEYLQLNDTLSVIMSKMQI